MPEGDTIHKVAAVLARELAGHALVRAELDGRPFPTLAGRRVVTVEAVGKHLLIGIEDGLTLRTHLGMHGSWHRYARDEPWRRPRWQASVALWTDEQVAVCFNAKEVEVLPTKQRCRHPLLTSLGPDLVSGAADLEDVVRRARRLAGDVEPVVDLLLDQRVAAGIGNVYKSEVLFLCRVHPLVPVSELSDVLLRRLYAEASLLLRANLGGGERITTTDVRPPPRHLPRLWVYGRGGRPCLDCGSPVRSQRLGRGLRSTYWCPRCQLQEPSVSGRAPDPASDAGPNGR